MGREMCRSKGLRQVLGPAWGPQAWEKATGIEANLVFKSTSEKKEKQVTTERKRKASESVKERRRQRKYKKTNDNTQQARRDYARHDSGQGVMDTVSDVPQDYLEKMMLDYYKTNTAITDQKVLEVERVTRGQGTADDIAGNIWLAERRKRITSSNTGLIARRRCTTKVANLVKNLLYSTFQGTAATEWGKLQEPETSKAYLDTKRPSSPGITVYPSGLVVHPEHHWLAASPDGLVTDPSSPEPAGIVEFKNPYKFREVALKDAVKQDNSFCLTETDHYLRLKHSHHYYYQVQAAMFCTKTKWCDFVVRTTVDLHIERIVWDPQFWMSVLPRLHDFYFTAILPELALPRMHTGGIREPAEWLKDPKAWEQQTKTL